MNWETDELPINCLMMIWTNFSHLAGSTQSTLQAEALTRCLWQRVRETGDMFSNLQDTIVIALT